MFAYTWSRSLGGGIFARLPRRSYSPRVVLHRAVTWFLCYLIAVAIAVAGSSYLQVVDFAMDADISTSALLHRLPTRLSVSSLSSSTTASVHSPLPFSPPSRRLLRRIASISCIGMEDQFTTADSHFFIDCHWPRSILSILTQHKGWGVSLSNWQKEFVSRIFTTGMGLGAHSILELLESPEFRLFCRSANELCSINSRQAKLQFFF